MTLEELIARHIELAEVAAPLEHRSADQIEEILDVLYREAKTPIERAVSLLVGSIELFRLVHNETEGRQPSEIVAANLIDALERRYTGLEEAHTQGLLQW